MFSFSFFDFSFFDGCSVYSFIYRCAVAPLRETSIFHATPLRDVFINFHHSS